MRSKNLLPVCRLSGPSEGQQREPRRPSTVKQLALAFVVFLAMSPLAYAAGFMYLQHCDMQRAIDTKTPVGSDAMHELSDQVRPTAPDVS